MTNPMSFSGKMMRTVVFPFVALLALLSSIVAHAQQTADTGPAGPQRPLVFVPGLLGSQLCRTGPDGEKTVVWGTVGAIGVFPSLALTEGADDVEPCGLIREVSFLGLYTQDVYGPFIERLEQAGYREGETLFIFDYDWRLSVFENAKRLGDFVEASGVGDGEFDIIAHSLGGLISRTYAHNDANAKNIKQLISAGTPWRGSVKALDLAEHGWGTANLFMGGLEGFRRTILTFPSMFELMPDYEGCCGETPSLVSRLLANRAEAWIALNWEGVNAETLPDLADVSDRQKELRRIVDEPLPADIQSVLVIGLDQRTPQQFLLEFIDGRGHFDIQTSWQGDGTVLRDSAVLEKRVTYPTSFSTHDEILSDTSVQDFLIAALANGAKSAIETVPVRQRTSILTSIGDMVELVGVAVVIDQPVYQTGRTATAIVHLRLANQVPADRNVLQMTVALPGEGPKPVTLVSDPQASDPSNPFEQSFSASFATGQQAGEVAVTVTIDNGVGEPRIATTVVPVLAQ
ncbi:esterase/lipase family protein [Roseibium algae]|uniref:Lecithin:cholesterol acyltransferase n=1 Tax=Roseibium algae TaxID=3123038 RepID=A0ABU8TNR3_9HYPH